MNHFKTESLKEFTARLKELSGRRTDMLIRQNDLKPADDGTLWCKHGAISPGSWMHSQLADKLRPTAQWDRRYYDNMLRQAPKLWAESMSTWLGRGEAAKENRLIRAYRIGNSKEEFEGRAFLSDSMRIFGYDDILFAGMDALNSIRSEVAVKELTLTDTKMWVRFEHQGRSFKVGGSDYTGGLEIGESEVGNGAAFAWPYLQRTSCKNSRVLVGKHGFRQVHLGKTLTEAFLLSDETRRKENELVMMKFKDVCRGVLAAENFQKLIDLVQQAHEERVETPLKSLEQLVQEPMIGEARRERLLEQWSKEGFTRLGLSEAVSAIAQREPELGDRRELEVFAGRVLDRDYKLAAA